MNTKQALQKLEEVIDKAEEKHPGNRWLVEAGAEEMGEVEAVPDRYAPGNIECLHLAAIMVRRFKDGTTPMPDVDGHSSTEKYAGQAIVTGEMARAKLTAAGVPE